ncbi:P-loop containing nucleoside triphosphate hydrolase protein [Lyophyllum atratum]|nr:P-loop containing nucleoside triphosphate hydrolase protein [Lyophyllum atratum]
MNDADRASDVCNTAVPSTPTRRAPLSTIPVPGNSPFDTPRCQKTPSSTPQPSTRTSPWPRIGKQVPIQDIVSVAEGLYACTPAKWQLQIFEKAAEGYDTFGITGTGSGKSLVYVLLAIAAELTRFRGIVIVLSPLKSLQKDQFNGKPTYIHNGAPININAVAINEDNQEDSVFTELGKGTFRICFASPEILLGNSYFKQLFRREDFRKMILAMVVDEAHVIETWKDEFRKAYGELNTVKIVAGSEIPWMALTATCSTRTFEVIYTSLSMGDPRSFWGIDLGADHPNLAQWVRPMEYSMSSMVDLFPFIPINPRGPESFEKTILYFRTRKLARRALRLCRSLVSAEFRKLMYAFTATASEGFKDKVTDLFRVNDVRIIFATLALRMGLDIPDVTRVVIFGVDSMSDAYQKGVVVAVLEI